MRRGLVVGLVVIAVIVIGFAMLFGGYVSARNQMVDKDEACKSAFSQVDIAMQRRADLIPNLVETVKGYAKQETTVFGDIANARARLLSAGSPSDKIAANNQLDGALGRLLVITENYPQLRSQENFLRLQDELAGTENRIAVERRRYNQAVQDYEVFIRHFPNNIYAGFAGFQAGKYPYFQASDAAKQVPNVKF